MLGIDTETGSDFEATPVPPMVCCTFAYDDASCEIVHHKDPALPELLEAALSEDVALANAPFDGAVISEKFPDLEPLWWDALAEDRILDVLTREKLLDLAYGRGLKRQYGLAQVAEKRARIVLDKQDPWRKQYMQLYNTPIAWWPEDAQAYARADGISTAISAVQQDIAARAFHPLNPLGNAGAQARAHWALHLSSLHGVHVDQIYTMRLDNELRIEQEQLADRLRRTGLVRADGSKDMARVRAAMAAEGSTLLTAGGTKPHAKTGKVAEPQLATSMEALSLLNLPPDHMLSLYQRYGSIQGLRSRTLKPFLGRSIVRTRWNELAENGRTTSSEPNIQNLPTKGGFRECLVPAPGNVFVLADYAKNELVTWAQVLLILFGPDAPTAKLGNMLAAGGDPHDEMAKAIAAMGDFGIPPRRLAKIVNFAFMGGAGAARVQIEAREKYGIRLDIRVWQQLRNAWLNTWYGQRYLNWISDQQDEYGKIAVEQFKSGRLRAGMNYAEAANTLFSGLAGDANKDCLWRLAVCMYTRPESDLYGARQALFTHDENGLECPRENADKVAAALERMMIDTYRDWCPDVPIGVDIQIVDRLPSKE